MNWSHSVIPWLVIALLFFWSVGAHNRLVRLRAVVSKSFEGVTTQFEALVDMLGSSAWAGGIEGGAGAESPMSSVMAAAYAPLCGPQKPLPLPSLSQQAASPVLMAATAQFSAALAAARPLNRNAIAALTAARNVLFETWEVSSQASPGGVLPNAETHFLWNRHMAQTGQATRQFNDAVAHYNTAVGQFPAGALAWLLRLRKAQIL